MKKYILPLVISFIISFLGLFVIGMRVFFPNHILIGISLYVISFIIFISTTVLMFKYKKKEILKNHVVHKVYSARYLFLFLFLFLLVGYVLYILIPVDNFEFSDDYLQLEKEFATDKTELSLIHENLNYTLSKFEEVNNFVKPDVVLDSETKTYIRSVWIDYLLLGDELENLTNKYNHFYQIDYLDNKKLHETAFLIGFNSFLSNYISILDLVNMIDNNSVLTNFLDEDSEFKDSYYNLKKIILHPKTIVLYNSWFSYYNILKEQGFDDCGTLCQDIDNKLKYIQNNFDLTLNILVDDPIKTIEYESSIHWFPILKNTAIVMSEIHDPFHNFGINFSTAQKIVNLSILQPGDILLERRDAHLTNLGIPGFWKHSALYIGTPEEVDDFFNNTFSNTSSYFNKTYPFFYKKWVTLDPFNFSYRVIEAIKPGVSLRSFEESANADHVLVLRPNLNKSEIFDSLNRSFAYYGLPYDYNFDFMSDDALICSELIYKSFEDLNFTLDLVSGRMLLRPHEIYEKFKGELNNYNNSELSFVYFITSDNSSSYNESLSDLVSEID